MIAQSNAIPSVPRQSPGMRAGTVLYFVVPVLIGFTPIALILFAVADAMHL